MEDRLMTENSSEVGNKDHLFKKGVSPNPGGRPKGITYFRELAKKYEPEVLFKMVDLMRNAEAEEIQYKAALTMKEWIYGKEKEIVQMDIDVTTEVEKMSTSDLKKLLYQSLPPLEHMVNTQQEVVINE